MLATRPANGEYFAADCALPLLDEAEQPHDIWTMGKAAVCLSGPASELITCARARARSCYETRLETWRRNPQSLLFSTTASPFLYS